MTKALRHTLYQFLLTLTRSSLNSRSGLCKRITEGGGTTFQSIGLPVHVTPLLAASHHKRKSTSGHIRLCYGAQIHPRVGGHQPRRIRSTG
jgi:hypothetical protein